MNLSLNQNFGSNEVLDTSQAGFRAEPKHWFEFKLHGIHHFQMFFFQTLLMNRTKVVKTFRSGRLNAQNQETFSFHMRFVKTLLFPRIVLCILRNKLSLW